MQCILQNITTKFKQYYPDIEVNLNKLYATLELNTEEYKNGEYLITLLTDDNEIVGEEMVKIGDFSSVEALQYKAVKMFKQYDRK